MHSSLIRCECVKTKSNFTAMSRILFLLVISPKYSAVAWRTRLNGLMTTNKFLTNQIAVVP